MAVTCGRELENPGALADSSIVKDSKYSSSVCDTADSFFILVLAHTFLSAVTVSNSTSLLISVEWIKIVYINHIGVL